MRYGSRLLPWIWMIAAFVSRWTPAVARYDAGKGGALQATGRRELRVQVAAVGRGAQGNRGAAEVVVGGDVGGDA